VRKILLYVRTGVWTGVQYSSPLFVRYSFEESIIKMIDFDFVSRSKSFAEHSYLLLSRGQENLIPPF